MIWAGWGAILKKKRGERRKKSAARIAKTRRSLVKEKKLGKGGTKNGTLWDPDYKAYIFREKQKRSVGRGGWGAGRRVGSTENVAKSSKPEGTRERKKHVSAVDSRRRMDDGAGGVKKW